MIQESSHYQTLQCCRLQYRNKLQFAFFGSGAKPTKRFTLLLTEHQMALLCLVVH